MSAPQSFPPAALLPRFSFRHLGWLLVSAVCATIYALMVRACGNEHRAVLGYLAYVVFFVWLPGWVALRLASRRPVGLTEAIALGLPLGYAIEISTFLLLSAIGLREAFVALPVAAVAAGGWILWSDASVNRAAFRQSNPWILLALSGVMLATVATAASQLFVQSPLAVGLMASPTHHDWVYLISRAAEIKQHWPLGDPSMVGAGLSYHYFLMTHIAAASVITGSEVSLLLLRCYTFPLSAALAMQVFMLGRLLTRSPLGGVLAAMLMLMTEEISFTTSSQWGTFFNLFIRWLYLSPTFFFGMIFTGALVLWIWRMASGPTRLGEMVLLVLLAMAGTGAKGTVVPPLMLALAGWMIIETWQRRQLAWRLGWILSALAVGFTAVYAGVLAEWGSAGAKLVPWASMRLAVFWQEHADQWTAALVALGAPRVLSQWLAQMACAVVILIGGSGVRLLALPYAARWSHRIEPKLVLWLGLVWLATQASGQLLEIDSNSQLYLLFPSRLMVSALSAAALLRYGPPLLERTRLSAPALRSAIVWLRDVGIRNAGIITLTVVLVTVARLVHLGRLAWWAGIGGYLIALLVFAPGRAALSRLKYPGWRQVASVLGSGGRFLWRVAPVAIVGGVLLVQINHWRLRNEYGFRLWLAADSTNSEVGNDMKFLHEGMFWLRKHTEPNAVIVANAFTPRNVYGRTAVVDDTTVDKYYYYSALAERRLWVEGPTYLRDQAGARRRMVAAARIFYGNVPPRAALPTGNPYYLLVDQELNDGARTRYPGARKVFENDRLQIFRVPQEPG